MGAGGSIGAGGSLQEVQLRFVSRARATGSAGCGVVVQQVRKGARVGNRLNKTLGTHGTL
jgi:hypothetical protein